MRKNWQSRALAFALSATMLVGLVPANAWATDDASVTPTAEVVETSVDTRVAGNEPKAPDAASGLTGADEEAAPVDASDDEAAPANDGAAAVAPAAAARAKADDGAQPAAAVDVVYLDGVKGNDASDGTTAATAVKTFAKAKELLGSDGTEIRVSGMVTVGDAQEWSLAEGQKVVRDASMATGSLVNVSDGSLTLSDITIDGGYGTTNDGVRNDSVTGSLIRSSGGSITLGAGSRLQNNHVVAAADGSQKGSVGGGAVGGMNATKITIDGGVIDNCAHFWNGGAIDLRGSQSTEGQVIFRSGTISNCAAGLSGGGINLNSWGAGDSMEMYGGTITGCSAGTNEYAWHDGNGEYPGYGGDGGAICAGYASLQITGGTFTDNSSLYRGGAICIREGSGAIIKATGDDIVISANRSQLRNATDGTIGSGNAPAVVGGGGIYVDINCKLRMDNALVTNNYAAVNGGGVSYCPTGTGDVKIAKGLAIYYNYTGSDVANDLVVIERDIATSDGFVWSDLSDPSNGTVHVSPTMLGGGAYNWAGADGATLPLDQLSDDAGFFGTAAPDQAAMASAFSEASVIISDNFANSFGGGIACNGILTSYEQIDTALVSLTVTKEWVGDDEAARPDSIRVNVLQDGVKIGFVDLMPDADGTWSTTVKDLPKADKTGEHVFTYTLEEEKVAVEDGDYAASYGEPVVDDNGNVTASVTNTKQLATKFSKQDVSGNELSGATMQVLDADGNVVDEWVSDGTRHEVLLGSGEYTLHEVIAPDGYEVATDIAFTVDSEAGTVTVKGSATAAPENTVVMVDEAKTVPAPDEPGKPGERADETVKSVAPKTGDATNGVLPIALGAAGIALVGGGIALAVAKRRSKE